MRHNFNQTGTVQWAEKGLPSSAACSYYKCTNCGEGFEHRYNQTPDIYEAMKTQNINMDDCKNKRR